MNGEVSTTGWRVLLADDDDDARWIVSQVLVRAGFRVDEARDGAELLDLFFADTDADTLVISDVGMPKVDGIEVVAVIRRSAADTPVMLVTGFRDERTLEGVRSSGADFVFHKPLDLSLLVSTALEIVARVLRGERPRPRGPCDTADTQKAPR